MAVEREKRAPRRIALVMSDAGVRTPLLELGLFFIAVPFSYVNQRLQTNNKYRVVESPAKILYKKLFVEALRRVGLYDQLPPGVLKFDWVVNIKPVGDGQAVMKYLAPNVYRVAICDNRIASVDKSGVTYTVKPSAKSNCETRHLNGESFVRAFAQHILPPRWKKVRGSLGPPRSVC